MPASGTEPHEPFEIPPEPEPEAPERDSPEPTRRLKVERHTIGADIPASPSTIRNAQPRVIE